MGLHEIHNKMCDYFIILLILQSSVYQKFLSVCALSFLLSFTFSHFSLPLSLSLTRSLFFSLNALTDNLIFMQNLGLVCLQSVTLILEDDFNKQVTLSRGGQILTSPNQGFNLNGKKQCQWYTFLTLTITTTQPKWSLLPLTDEPNIYGVPMCFQVLSQTQWRPPRLWGLVFISSGISVYLQCRMGQGRHRVFPLLHKVLLGNAVPGYFQFGFDAETVVAI